MKILFIGDIVGRPGRECTAQFLSRLGRDQEFDVVLANAENAAGGNGLTREVAENILSSGVDGLSMGNHVWDKKEILDFIEDMPNIIRPVNYPPGTPGAGSTVLVSGSGCRVGFVNAIGRVFSGTLLDCPFRTLAAEVKKLRETTSVVVVDFHAEATSEKIAMGWFLDGKVSAVIGTHTHVQTADETILPGGTAYITDVGMTGPHLSVIGVKKELVINKFLTQMPVKFEVAKGPAQFCAVILDVDEASGKARTVQRVFLKN